MALLSLRRMTAALTSVVGLASLVIAALPPSARAAETADTLLSIEVDVIFPRNETYLQPEFLPIAFAIQNVTQLPQLGNFSLGWDIMPYGDDGNTPGGLVVDYGTLHVPENAGGEDPVILVAYTSVTTWAFRNTYDYRFMLQLSLQWGNGSQFCGAEYYTQFKLGILMFSIETPDELLSDKNHTAIAANITDAPDCPEFGELLSIQAYPTPTTTGAAASETTQCPYVMGYNGLASAGTPCAVTLDAAAKSSIGSLASSMATAAYLATAYVSVTTSIPSLTPTNAAVAGSPTLGPALAAAGIMYGLVNN